MASFLKKLKEIYRLKVLWIYVSIFLVTFLLILPVTCSTWVYSWYLDSKLTENSAKAILNDKNEVRRKEATQFLSQLDAEESQKWHKKRLEEDLDVICVVKTVDRTTVNSNPDTGYLTQTSTMLDREIRRETNFRVGYFICNVDRHPDSYRESQMLVNYYFSVVKNLNGTWRAPPLDEQKREREKNDYLFCLESGAKFRARYVLMIEDDTQPYENVFSNLRDVLRNKLERKTVRGEVEEDSVTKNDWAFLKLYYPERWAGYGLETTHFFELYSVGAVFGSLFVFLNYVYDYRRRNVTRKMYWFHMLVGFCFGIILVLALGRQHVMELRRYSSSTLLMTKAPGCCTPAVVFPRPKIGPLVKFLKGVTCGENFGVDLALDSYAVTSSLRFYLIQPNLFHHRGVYSTLTRPKNQVEFLFDA